MVSSYCVANGYKIKVTPEVDDKGITTDDFLDWLENGFGCGDIVEYGGYIAMIGKTSYKAATIIGVMEGERITISNAETSPSVLKQASQKDIDKFIKAMLNSRVQFNALTYSLMDKYIPKADERVIFHGMNNGASRRGIGVVKEVIEEGKKAGEIILYCYYLFEENQVGFSMNEEGICNISDYLFEPMDDKDTENRISEGNIVYLQRRLNEELAKQGVKWNQRAHRVEPLDYRRKLGEEYWYIDEGFEVHKNLDNYKVKANTHYVAGNYFISRMQAEVVRKRILEASKHSMIEKPILEASAGSYVYSKRINRLQPQKGSEGAKNNLLEGPEDSEAIPPDTSPDLNIKKKG